MSRRDYNKFLIDLGIEMGSEKYVMLQDLADSMVKNGMSYEECAKIVKANIK